MVVFLLGIISAISAAGQPISGVINDYTTVLTVAGNRLVVGNPFPFSPGDKVLVIQMKGALLHLGNNSGFGDIDSLNGAGNFEFGCVSHVSGSQIYLSDSLRNYYDPTGAVQMVRVPVYSAPVVSGNISPLAWNGIRGGIVVLETPGRLTLNADIDVSANGFRGGTVGTGNFNCLDANYVTPAGVGGNKGEGIGTIPLGLEASRGKAANGGGGSNRGDSGGGGGSNAGAGGFGGRIYTGCGGSSVRGVGGLTLSANNSRVYMGGGGGGGYRNDGSTATVGGAGGGIVIIIADTIVGNGNSIRANGDDVTILTHDEGAGGGGGGGSVYIQTNEISNALIVETNGGKGGDNFNNIYTVPCHGPGGGGGGGLFSISLPGMPATVTHTAYPGVAGQVTNPASVCFGGTNQATAGDTGMFSPNLALVTTYTSRIYLGPDSSICAGDTLVLDPGKPWATILWSDSSTGATLPVATADTYWVEVTEPCGTSRDTVIVTVDTLPVINIGPDTAVCTGDSFTFDAGAGFASYFWPDSSGLPTWTVDSAGTFPVMVIDGNGCIGRDTASLSLEPPPIIFLGNDSLICNGDTVWLEATAGMAGYLWHEGTTDSIFVADTSGQYSVTITDSIGCSSSDTFNLTVVNNPPLNLGNDTLLCVGDTIMLDAGQGYPFYEWQNLATTRTFFVTVTDTYYVTITDANGCSNSDTISVIVNPNPVISLGPDTLLCPNVPFVLSPGNQFLGYEWQDGSTDSTFTIDSTGLYWVHVTDSNGCEDADTMLATVGQLSVNLGPDTSICDGEYYLLNPGAGFASIVWQDSTTTRVYLANQPGVYHVTVMGVGGCSASDTMEILSVLPVPVIDLGNDTIFCDGNSVMLDAGPGFASYDWSNGVNSQILTVSNAGVYSVTVTDNNGCEGVDTLEVPHVDMQPTVMLGVDTSICANDSLILSALPSGQWTYLWSTGDTTPTIQVGQPGIYGVEVTNTCGTADDQVAVSIQPVPDLKSLRDTFYCDETFLLDPGNYDAYVWQDGSTDRFFEVTGPDTLFITVTNKCGSGTDTIIVLDGCPPPLYFPTGFTPNRDGLNDRFRPTGLQVNNYSLLIFDRWGKLLFETRDQYTGWDGKFNGNDLPEGVYVWKAQYDKEEFGEFKPFTQAGSITLIR